MAEDNKRITQLDPLTAAAAADVIPIVDVSDTSTAPSGTTKQITTEDLFASPQPIGSSTASTGKFTSLQLPLGSTIAEFSTDGTLSGDSDTAIPTEKAVKAYVDASIPIVNSDRIESGDSSIIVVDSTASLGVIDITVDSSLVGTITSLGLQLSTGARVNEFSTDITLAGSSNTAIPTENAVKTYIDNKIISTGVLNVYTVSSDSTAFNGDALIVDTTAGDVNIVLDTYPDSKIIVKKITSDSNMVNITVNGGTIDNQPVHTITEINKAYTFISDGLNYYIV